MRTTAIFNLKGGVAKTITTAAMADILAIQYHKRVLVIDADAQGNLSQYFGVSAQEGASTLDLLQGTHEPVYSDWVTPARPDVAIDIIPSDMTLLYADVDVYEGRFTSRHSMEELRASIEEDAQSPDEDARAAAYDYMLIDCPAACPYARPEQPDEQPPEPQAEQGGMGIAPPPKLENRVPWTPGEWQRSRELFSSRLREQREKTGMDRQAFADKIGEYKATYSAWENGNLPGSDRLPKLAQTLGVSTDYLYGLTDDPAPKAAPAQWQPLDEAHWPADGQLVVLAFDNGLGETCYTTARCVSGYHDIYPFVDTDTGCELEEPSHGDYEAGYWWMPLPEKEDA